MKSAPTPNLGIPVPANLPAAVKAIDMYWGPQGFTPAYDQAARTSLDISTLRQQTVNGAAEYVVPTAAAVTAGASGPTDFYFTFGSEVAQPPTAADFESDFSPVLDVPLAVALPAPGQPIVLPASAT